MISIKKKRCQNWSKCCVVIIFLAQNLLLMMTFCGVCVSRLVGPVSVSSVLQRDDCSPEGQSPSPATMLLSLSQKTVLFLVQGSWLLFLKPKWSMDVIRASPLSAQILPEQKAGAWCLHKIPSFGAAFSLSATSIASSWGTAPKDTAVKLPGARALCLLIGGVQGTDLAASARGAWKEQRSKRS